MEQYISFDVFDTLIKRSVAQPTDIFRLMENAKDSQGQLLPKGFADKRIEAERAVNREKGKPATFEEIYDKLQVEYGGQAQSWKQMELQLEMAGCRPNPACVSQFNEYLEEGHKIVLISDMYLPSSFIAAMLEKCGIRGYQKLFVSCEYGARKSDCSLFRAVIAELGIKPWQLLHIGDAKRGDFAKPLSMGIRVKFPVAKDQKKLCRVPPAVGSESALSYRTLQASIANCSRNMNEYESQGCALFGPILVGYVNWLAEQLIQDEIQDVYFLSRDGWVLMRAFNALHIPNIRAHYLYTSRRAYLVPIFWMHPEKETVISYVNPLNRRQNLRVFLSKIGLNPMEYADKSAKYGLDIEHTYDYDMFSKSETFACFYDEIKDDIIRNSKNEYIALAAYLRNQKFRGTIALADVGYTGIIQYALQEVLKQERTEVNVKGYYLGLRSTSDFLQKKIIQAKGFLFDVDRNQSIYHRLQSAILLYELQFLRQEGSLKNFQIVKGTAEPQFLESEFMVRDSGFSEAAFWGEYQKGAVSFVEYCTEAFENNLKIEPSAAIWNWMRLIRKPTLKEAAFFGDFHAEDAIVKALAHPRSLLYYLFYPRILREAFLNGCEWKVGFMKRLMKIPLPYAKIYDYLRAKYNRK